MRIAPVSAAGSGRVESVQRIGIAEVQGDRRPEFRYCAHRLYGDTVAPTRARGLVSYPKG